jgi:hypothetical protein
MCSRGYEPGNLGYTDKSYHFQIAHTSTAMRLQIWRRHPAPAACISASHRQILAMLKAEGLPPEAGGFALQ